MPERYPSLVVVGVLVAISWGAVALFVFIALRFLSTTDVAPDAVTDDGKRFLFTTDAVTDDGKRVTLMSLPSTQDATLQRLQALQIPDSYGARVDAGIAVGGTAGVWRNDTTRWVFLTGLTGLEVDTPLVPDLTLTVGDKQITGGAVSAATIYSQTNTPDAPAVAWPGSQPVPPGAQVQIAAASAITTRISYGVVVAGRTLREPPSDWPEPRWLTVTAKAVTGQQSPNVELPYDATVIDYVRNSVDIEQFLATTTCKIAIGTNYVTLNSLTADFIPINVNSPDLQIGMAARRNTQIWFYVEVQTVAAAPSIVFRVAKRWGDVG